MIFDTHLDFRNRNDSNNIDSKICFLIASRNLFSNIVVFIIQNDFEKKKKKEDLFSCMTLKINWLYLTFIPQKFWEATDLTLLKKDTLKQNCFTWPRDDYYNF